MFAAADGIRYLRPEIVLSFKARAHRPQDEADFEAVLPLLDDVAAAMAARRDRAGATRRSVAGQARGVA